jgi:hypothetical protein
VKKTSEELYDLLGGDNLDPISDIIVEMFTENPHDSLIYAIYVALSERKIRDYISIDKNVLRLIQRMCDKSDLSDEKLYENCEILLRRFN